MDRARLDDLWSRFIAGGVLHPDEEQEVADALEADPRLLQELSQDLKLDGSLRGLGLVERDENAFMTSFNYRLRTERDGTRFIATVKQKMKRSRKPPTRRWERSSWTAARAGFAAAVLLAVLGLILAASSSSAPARKSAPPTAVRRAPERIESPEPRAPAPPPTPAPPRAPEPDFVLPPRAPAPAPTPEPPSEKKPEPVPPKPSEPPKPPPSRVDTVVRAVVATFTRVTGDVLVASTPVKAGQKLFAGLPIESTGAKSGAQIQFPDHTRLELGPDTQVSEVQDARGKRIVLARGQVTAEVARQPADQPFVVATPHGEARVLGTVFRISVDASSTRLDVKEGRVRMTRASDQKSVDVPAGCFVAAGVEKGDLDLNSESKVTVSFQDGVSPTPRYAGTSDATIVEAPKLAEKNSGGHQQLWVDGDTTVGDDRYILLRWDLAGLPAGCRVLSATIELQVTNDSKGTTFDAHELKRDWAEKDVTWKFASAKVPWQAPGAQGPQDRGALMATLAPNKPGLYSVRLSPEGLSVLQSWIDAPATNNGLIISNPANQDAIGVHSREATLPANRPRLSLTFVPRK